MAYCKIGLITCGVVIVGILMAFYLPRQYFDDEDEPRLILNTEWYDSVASSIRKMQLSFYPQDNAVEMYDLQTKKMFLKRYVGSDIRENDLYIGNTVVILSRQLKIIDYADEKSKETIGKQRQKTFAMIKPDAVHCVGEIVDLIQSQGFQISQMKMVQLSHQQASDFYQEHDGRSFFEPLLDYITSGKVIALELIGSEAVVKWRTILGPTDSKVAQEEVPDSLRARFGTDKQANAAHGSDSIPAAHRELSFFFPTKGQGSSIPAVAELQNNTCCIIKPHAISAGHLGSILTTFTQEGFRITGLQMFRLERIQAEEFLEVYKEVVNEYPRMVQQLISGPLVAMEISGDENIPQKVREFVGPMDPSIAKELRPGSLRARFGEDKVKNAVHCSDLPEDGPLEVEYFFQILQ